MPWLLALLAVAVGLPFFAVSATSPLLQAWFARTGHPAARDPYVLYAMSNLGSMLALLAYPAVVERVLRLEATSIRDAADRLDEAFARAVELLAAARGRVIVSGVGKSGLIARKLAATFTSTGTAASYLHPIDSLHGRREDIGRSIRLRFTAVLDRTEMGEFSLAPAQGPVRAAFVPLDRLQRDLAIPDRANTVLLARDEAGSADAAAVTTALRSAASLADLGLDISAAPSAGVAWSSRNAFQSRSTSASRPKKCAASCLRNASRPR